MIQMPPREELEQVAHDLARARRILFITGAGLSADSGLPTYRGIGGLYESDLTREGLPIEVALSGQMMLDRPALCWRYIAQLETACRHAQHNAAHRIIAALERWRPEVWTLTQNIDGFHRAAGSRNLIEIHGDVYRLLCLQCGRRSMVESYAGLQIPPHCDDCAGLLRPEVVLFGEMLPVAAVTQYEAVLAAGPELVFSIGTTSVFPYIAAPVLDARRRGVPVIEINPGHSEVSAQASLRWRCGAVAALTALSEILSIHFGDGGDAWAP